MLARKDKIRDDTEKGYGRNNTKRLLMKWDSVVTKKGGN